MATICTAGKNHFWAQKKLRTSLLLMACALFPVASNAANLKFLDTSLMSQLSEAEIKSFKQDLGAALGKTPDQEIIHWTSKTSGIQIQAKPRLSFTEGTNECRRTLFKLSKANAKPEYYRFDICRDATQGWHVRDSLISKLSDEDWRLMEGTVTEVLDSDKDNKIPASWFNPVSKGAGVVVPIAYVPQAGVPCREIAISIINSNGGTMDGTYTFCKKGDSWERK
ncbi:MAG TPA: hypothetical protein VLC79_16745 [Cellvibrio sp.]|nr:hypothetical protein [Cellvibrio sp.]